MTITLHWWLVPIFVVVIALIFATIADDGGSFNFVPLLIFIAGLIAAACIVVGHYL